MCINLVADGYTEVGVSILMASRYICLLPTLPLENRQVYRTMAGFHLARLQ